MNGTNGKQSEYPEIALVPYPVSLAATKGDPDAMKIVLQVYTFAMNTAEGRLIEIKMPARSEHEARSAVGSLIHFEHPSDHPLNHFWLNDVEDYK